MIALLLQKPHRPTMQSFKSLKPKADATPAGIEATQRTMAIIARQLVFYSDVFALLRIPHRYQTFPVATFYFMSKNF